MHTLKVVTKDFGEIAVLHHGDWSGEARIIWHEGNQKHEAELPASLLLVLGKEAAEDALKRQVVAAIESWDPGVLKEPK